jgi:hypothetical protein
MSVLPNFLIIGMAKAGTTPLFAALKQHPQIFMSRIKEPRFFAFMNDPPRFGGPSFHDYIQSPTITEIADYEALFDDAGTKKARGEASTIYSYYPGDKPAVHIRHYLPDVRLIILLRQPAARTYANFVHCIRNDWEPLGNFVQALADEPRRIRDNWSYFLRYRQNSDYLTQLQRYYDRYDRHQISVYLYDDLCKAPLTLVQDVFRFLEVDDSFVPDISGRYNVSLLPISLHIHRVLNRMRRATTIASLRRIIGRAIRINLYRPTIPADIYEELTDEFRPDILRLQDMIDRDLKNWISGG